jgi:hypothetical protein
MYLWSGVYGAFPARRHAATTKNTRRDQNSYLHSMELFIILFIIQSLPKLLSIQALDAGMLYWVDQGRADLAGVEQDSEQQS